MEKKKIRSQEQMHEIQVIYKRPVYDEMPKIRSSCDAIEIIRATLKDHSLDYQEHFWCFYLTHANKVLGYCEIGKGDATGVIVNIPMLFSIALKVSAKAILTVHNHPSGTLKISESDKRMHDKICGVADLFSLNLLDNIIITSESHVSFIDEGYSYNNTSKDLNFDPTLPF